MGKGLAARPRFPWEAAIVKIGLNARGGDDPAILGWLA